MSAHLDHNPIPLRSLRGDIPLAVEAVVLTAMRRQPEHRYQSARDLLADLDRVDELDPASFDLRPEPPMGGVIGGAEGPALLRFALHVAGAFVSIVVLVILLTIAIR